MHAFVLKIFDYFVFAIGKRKTRVSHTKITFSTDLKLIFALTNNILIMMMMMMIKDAHRINLFFKYLLLFKKCLRTKRRFLLQHKKIIFYDQKYIITCNVDTIQQKKRFLGKGRVAPIRFS